MKITGPAANYPSYPQNNDKPEPEQHSGTSLDMAEMQRQSDAMKAVVQDCLDEALREEEKWNAINESLAHAHAQFDRLQQLYRETEKPSSIMSCSIL